MTILTAVIKLLADGGSHSDIELGRALSLRPAEIDRAIAELRAAGVEVQATAERGYKLAAPLMPLDADIIRARLAPLSGCRIDLVERVDSTNRYLMQRAATVVSGSAILAEAQDRGRGRRGRSWIATPYQNLLLSFAWWFDAGPAAMTGLSLAAGLAVLRALEDYGVTGIGLKWPNDILWQRRKLAGVLVEVQGEMNGPSLAVVGVGINGRIADGDAAAIDQPWADLHTITGATVDRNELAALVVAHLARACRTYGARGFASFRPEWERRHVFHQQRVQLLAEGDTWSGVVDGVDDAGALRLRDADGGRHLFHSGEISLRPAA